MRRPERVEQAQHYPGEVPAGPSRDGARPGLAWWAAVAAVLVVQAVVVAALTKRSYFFAEDFRFLAELHDGPIDADLLGYNVFGHFVPGLALGNHLFSQAFGTSWTAAAVVILLIQLGGSVAFLRLLVALHGPTWWVPWATAVFSLSVVMLNNAVWWAAMWTMGATTACAVSAFGCAQRYINTRRRRHLVSLAVMAALSFSFFEKSIVLCVYVGLFALIVGGMSERESWAERVRRALAVWPIWVILATVASIDLTLYVLGGYAEQRSPAPSAGLTTEYLLRALPEGSFTTVLGIAHPSVDPPGPSWWVPALATSVFVVIIAWTSWRSRVAGRTWLWFFLSSLVSLAFVALGRLSVLGVDLSVHMLRYQVETNYLLILALTVALPAALLTASRDARALSARRWRLVATILAIPLLLGWLASVRSISEDSPGRAADRYFAALRADGPPAKPFLDYPVPEWIVPSPMYPWNMPSLIYGEIDPEAEVTIDPRGARVIDHDGEVRDVRLRMLYGPASTNACIDPDGAPVSLAAGMQSPARPSWDPLMVVVDYAADQSAHLIFTGKDEQGRPVAAAGTLRSDFVVEGRGRLAFPTTVPLTEVGVMAKGGRVCVRTLSIAVLE